MRGILFEPIIRSTKSSARAPGATKSKIRIGVGFSNEGWLWQTARRNSKSSKAGNNGVQTEQIGHTVEQKATLCQ